MAEEAGLEGGGEGEEEEGGEELEEPRFVSGAVSGSQTVLNFKFGIAAAAGDWNDAVIVPRGRGRGRVVGHQVGIQTAHRPEGHEGIDIVGMEGQVDGRDDVPIVVAPVTISSSAVPVKGTKRRHGHGPKSKIQKQQQPLQRRTPLQDGHSTLGRSRQHPPRGTISIHHRHEPRQRRVHRQERRGERVLRGGEVDAPHEGRDEGVDVEVPVGGEEVGRRQ